MTVVLNASALLAYLQDEPGGEVVEAVLNVALMSSVNWAEVVQKSIAAGWPTLAAHSTVRTVAWRSSLSKFGAEAECSSFDCRSSMDEP